VAEEDVAREHVLVAEDLGGPSQTIVECGPVLPVVPHDSDDVFRVDTMDERVTGMFQELSE
jgi:hypothetical protein